MEVDWKTGACCVCFVGVGLLWLVWLVTSGSCLRTGEFLVDAWVVKQIQCKQQASLAAVGPDQHMLRDVKQQHSEMKRADSLHWSFELFKYLMG